LGILGPDLDLFLWSLLQNKKDLAMEMWKHVMHPVRSAILGLSLYVSGACVCMPACLSSQMHEQAGSSAVANALFERT